MAQARPSIAFVPRLLPTPLAAAYLGMGETKLRTLNIPRKVMDGKRVYERADLDAYADGLTYEGEAPSCNDADAIFGMGKSG